MFTCLLVEKERGREKTRKYIYIYILLWILATPACCRPRLSRLRPRAPTGRGNPVVAFRSTPKSSYGCVFTHTTTLSMLCPRYRVNRRIVDLPNYSRGQTTERLYLNWNCSDSKQGCSTQPVFHQGTQRCWFVTSHKIFNKERPW